MRPPSRSLQRSLALLRRFIADRPQPLQRVELAHARQHDVDDDVAEIDEHPFGFAFAFDAERLAVEALGKLHHFIGDRFDVPGRGAGGDDHVIADAGLAADVDLDDIVGFQFGDRVVDRLEQDFGRRRRIRKAGLDDLRGAGQGLVTWVKWPEL